jgi:cystathionine beta-lyase/cystathionine gamma-synthase
MPKKRTQKQPSAPGFATLAIHAGQEPDPSTGAIMTPVYLTSTYVQTLPGEHKGYDYSRTKNPTRTALEQNLAGLEGGRFGLCFASGMGAINCVLTLLRWGDHVVAGNDMYGGTYRILRRVYEKLGLGATFVDMTDLAAVEAAIKPETRVLFLESPTNPLLRVYDLKALAKLAKGRGILVVVDNTFATPALQRPLELGADVVVHSATKYLGGHSDVVLGALVLNDAELRDKLAFLQNSVGATPGPMDCFLVLRGTKTLHLRMERHCENAAKVARFLAGHKKVARVYYPGLPAHPQHALAKRQMSGFGGMVSFELKASLERSKRFSGSLTWFALAESLGGVESLIDHPVSMTHGSIPARGADQGRAAGRAPPALGRRRGCRRSGRGPGAGTGRSPMRAG